MNLYASPWELASKMYGFSRKYHLGLSILKSSNSLTGLIILGDGTPDDFVVCMISHHLNGSTTAGIVKPPGKTGISTFDLIRNYMGYNRQLQSIVLFVDGEESDKKIISEELERRLKKQNITAKISSSQNENRFNHYDCNIDGRPFKLGLIINGRDDLPCKKHMIEDHLLLVASELNLINLANFIDEQKQFVGDPKQTWNDSLSEENKEKVFKELSTRRKLVEINFPQQVMGCNFVKQ